MRDAHEGM